MPKNNKQSSKYYTIMQYAGRLFLEQGYCATSMRQIAGDLGISLGLISYHFKSKSELAKAILAGQLQAETAIVHDYVNQDQHPILFSGAITKLQYTIMSSPKFLAFYLDVLREDVYFEMIIESGIDTYRKINTKYNLGFSDDYLILYGNFIASSIERTLMLYARQNPFVDNIADTLFFTYMGRLYGDEALLKECCIQTEQIVSKILSEHPYLLAGWYSDFKQSANT